MSRDVVLAFSGPLPNSYIRRQDFYTFRVAERERERAEKEDRSIKICGD